MSYRRHIHWPRWTGTYGIYRYEQCRCRARRTIRVTHDGYSALQRGWPTPEQGWTPR